MTVLIDTNVVLDALLNNSEFTANSKEIFHFAEQKRFIGYISASAVTDIFYISQKKLGKKTAKEAIKHTLSIFYPATVTDQDIYKALDLTWDDFEDSVQFVVGEGLPVNYIVTRNTQDFSSGNIQAVTPEQFMQIIADM
ncbi:MAG: PIN domain-containing protein [Treponema sp.]|jgi:predicted nucleic acid-binding protein|nr:PIN domain-containing protein [Treponema sp.]